MVRRALGQQGAQLRQRDLRLRGKAQLLGPQPPFVDHQQRGIENAIRRQPGIYLWSHRRWRHEWKEEYEKNTLE